EVPRAPRPAAPAGGAAGAARERGPSTLPPSDELLAVLKTASALVVCNGAPMVDAALLERAPQLRLVGELEGDRFAHRLDVDACSARNVVAVDTTNGSSYPVSEWALGMTLIALRNAGHHFRRMIEGEVGQDREQPGYSFGELTGKRVGL